MTDSRYQRNISFLKNNYDFEDDSIQILLLKACFEDDSVKVKQYAEDFTKFFNFKNKGDYARYFGIISHWAAHTGDYEICKILIKNKLFNEFSAINVAVTESNEELIKWLLTDFTISIHHSIAIRTACYKRKIDMLVFLIREFDFDHDLLEHELKIIGKEDNDRSDSLYDD